MAVNNSAFSFNPDIVAQMSGSGKPVPGTVTPTFAASMALAAVLLYSRYVRILGVSTVSATVDLTTTFVAPAGARLTVQVDNSASGTVTATFGTGFRSTGTVAPTASKSILVDFSSDGITWNEVGRSASALA